MICPNCGVEMNMHAEKVVPASGREGHLGYDDFLGGTIVEIHTCPKCGITLSREATS